MQQNEIETTYEIRVKQNDAKLMEELTKVVV